MHALSQKHALKVHWSELNKQQGFANLNLDFENYLLQMGMAKKSKFANYAVSVSTAMQLPSREVGSGCGLML